MMTYTAPNGHIIESLPYPQEVIYSCECSITDYSDGIYHSDEIKGAATEIGIQGIHITRKVDNGTMIIKLVEFSDEELIEYINNNKLIDNSILQIKPVDSNNETSTNYTNNTVA